MQQQHKENGKEKKPSRNIIENDPTSSSHHQYFTISPLTSYRPVSQLFQLFEVCFAAVSAFSARASN